MKRKRCSHAKDDGVTRSKFFFFLCFGFLLFFLLWYGLAPYKTLRAGYLSGGLCVCMCVSCTASLVQQTTTRIVGRPRFAQCAESEKTTKKIYAMC